MHKFSFADISWQMDGNNHNAFSRFADFTEHHIKDADLHVEIAELVHFSAKAPEPPKDSNYLYEILSDGSQSFFIYHPENRQLQCCMKIDKDWQNAQIYYEPTQWDAAYAASGPMTEVLFRNKLLMHQGLVIHAAAIEWQNQGIIFSAPSGTGKSTHAYLWIKHFQADLINGDRAALRYKDNHLMLHGTPWSGSKPEFKNTQVPLKAIIIIEQSKDNVITRLTGYDGIRYLMPRCFLPYFNDRLMKYAMETLERIIADVPVYLLKCRPDKEAAELVKQCIMS